MIYPEVTPVSPVSPPSTLQLGSRVTMNVPQDWQCSWPSLGPKRLIRVCFLFMNHLSGFYDSGSGLSGLSGSSSGSSPPSVLVLVQSRSHSCVSSTVHR
jgi:hypothetical protein